MRGKGGWRELGWRELGSRSDGVKSKAEKGAARGCAHVIWLGGERAHTTAPDQRQCGLCVVDCDLRLLVLLAHAHCTPLHAVLDDAPLIRVLCSRFASRESSVFMRLLIALSLPHRPPLAMGLAREPPLAAAASFLASRWSPPFHTLFATQPRMPLAQVTARVPFKSRCLLPPVQTHVALPNRLIR